MKSDATVKALQASIASQVAILEQQSASLARTAGPGQIRIRLANNILARQRLLEEDRATLARWRVIADGDHAVPLDSTDFCDTCGKYHKPERKRGTCTACGTEGKFLNMSRADDENAWCFPCHKQVDDRIWHGTCIACKKPGRTLLRKSGFCSPCTARPSDRQAA